MTRSCHTTVSVPYVKKITTQKSSGSTKNWPIKKSGAVDAFSFCERLTYLSAGYLSRPR